MAETNEKVLCTIEGGKALPAVPGEIEEGIAQRMDEEGRPMGFHFTVPGDPQGKGRPRTNRKTGKTYTPPETRNYETLIRECYVISGGSMLFPKGSPVWLQVVAYYAMPESFPKWKKRAIEEGAEAFATKKPDFDNVAKVVADALNGLAYHDDAQVVFGQCLKVYGTRPRVEVWLAGLVDPLDAWRLKQGGRK